MPQFPKNELAQILIASCVARDIHHIVISPGSRNAPLTIGFSNHPNTKTYSIVDERSAAFFALGMAQQLQKPVAIVCTSGSALLNYYPAISEAYYSDIPLVVISADRPKHLINIGDGQTIMQENVFGNHVLFGANLKEDSNISVNLNDIEKALNISITNRGPVHINIPLDEPLYEISEKIVQYNSSNSQLVEDTSFLNTLNEYAEEWNSASKKMILVGQHFPNSELQEFLEKIVEDPSVLVLIENTANVSHSKFINSIDKLIFPFEKSDEMEAFQPDILLSIGGLVVSKKIKQHLRKYQPTKHWHVDTKKALDTFLCLNHHIKATPVSFFHHFLKKVKPVKSDYQCFWLRKKALRLKKHYEFLNACVYSDLKVFETVLKSIPEKSHIQFSNSSVIRYSQLFDIDKSVTIFCNRGTSGIDGSTSTAIGAATITNKNTVFVTGDISFFYDSNALWNAYIPSNFKIILINNGGGGIFRFIPGPQKTNALDYFETPHNLTAKHLCKMFNLNYTVANNLNDLNNKLKLFFKDSEKPGVLEIFTPQKENDKVLKTYFNNLKE